MTEHRLLRRVMRTWRHLTEAIDRAFPMESPRRKLLQLISVILLVEGLSVLVLFSYVGMYLGLASLLIGTGMAVVLFRAEHGVPLGSESSPGVRLASFAENIIGGSYAVMAVGAALVVLVVLYNMFVSELPSYGDVDTLCIMFGGLLLVFPLVPEGWKNEAIFALFFLTFVVLFLAVPQAIMSIGGGGGTSSIGNWYVHYMLAAPFAWMLELIGIPATSVGNFVTMQFQDGSVHTLAISAYCAGLYSFSIFLSAFFSYVLVFERLKNHVLLGVLGFGLAIAYFGNILRMVVIGVVGYYRGIEALFWAHENVGWLIFIGWSALFWWLILSRISTPERANSVRTAPSKSQDDCEKE